MNLLQGIDTLLEVDVVGRELGLGGSTTKIAGLAYCVVAPRKTPLMTDLVLSLSQLLLGVLESSRGKGGELTPKDTT